MFAFFNAIVYTFANDDIKNKLKRSLYKRGCCTSCTEPDDDYEQDDEVVFD